MKFFAFILSIYILSLNFISCGDDTPIVSNANSSISKIVKQEHQDLDFCSPFCTCQCCQINITPLKLTNFTIPTPYHTHTFSKPNFFYQNGNESDFVEISLKPPIT